MLACVKRIRQTLGGQHAPLPATIQRSAFFQPGELVISALAARTLGSRHFEFLELLVAGGVNSGPFATPSSFVTSAGVFDGLLEAMTLLVAAFGFVVVHLPVEPARL